MQNEKEKKFYYQGKYFSKEEDFLSYVEEFTFRDMDEESFNSLFDMLKKDLWMNIHESKISNEALKGILEEGFIYLMSKFFGKNETEKDKSDGK